MTQFSLILQSTGYRKHTQVETFLQICIFIVTETSVPATLLFVWLLLVCFFLAFLLHAVASTGGGVSLS